MTKKQIITLCVLAVACLAVNRKAIIGLFSSKDEVVYEDDEADDLEGLGDDEQAPRVASMGGVSDVLSGPGTTEDEKESGPASPPKQPETPTEVASTQPEAEPVKKAGPPADETQEPATGAQIPDALTKLLGDGVGMVQRPRTIPLERIDSSELPFFDPKPAQPETKDDGSKAPDVVLPTGPTPEELAAQKRAAELAEQMKKIEALEVRAIVMSRRGGAVRIGGINLRAGSTIPGTRAVIKDVKRTGIKIEVMGEQRELHLFAVRAAAVNAAAATPQKEGSAASGGRTGPVGSVIKAPERSAAGAESSSGGSE